MYISIIKEIKFLLQQVIRDVLTERISQDPVIKNHFREFFFLASHIKITNHKRKNHQPFIGEPH